MDKDFKRLFSLLNKIDPPIGLEQSILSRINSKQQKRAKIQLVVFSLLDLACLAGLFIMAASLADLLKESGFTEYFSIIFSDSGAVIYYWQTLIMILAESLPVLSLAAFLSLLAVFIWSVGKTLSNTKLFHYQFNYH